MADFLDRLRNGPPIVADGGMGALVSGAVPRLRCPEEANLRAPESVVAVHASYIRAGAELIETNTFGANRRKLQAHFLEQELEAINSAGARLAREAREVAGRDVFVAGAIGPLGELEVFDPAEHGPLYAEQARVLEGRGVDLFMVETFFDVEELVDRRRGSPRRLVAADRRAADLRRRGRDDRRRRRRDGRRALAGARRLRDRHEPRRRPPRGAHGARRHAREHASPGGAAEHRPREPRPAGGSSTRTRRPEYFSEFAAQAVALGARIVGGCCGTTPAQIAAIRSALDEGRVPAAPFEAAERDLPLAAPADAGETRLARALREGEWVVCVELDPPKGGTSDGAAGGGAHAARVRARSGSWTSTTTRWRARA